jgi:hypothetical protein
MKSVTPIKTLPNLNRHPESTSERGPGEALDVGHGMAVARLWARWSGNVARKHGFLPKA